MISWNPVSLLDQILVGLVSSSGLRLDRVIREW